MELILINIGLQTGVIKQGLFSILVLMAIVTTLMATPLFNWIMRRDEGKATAIDKAKRQPLAQAIGRERTSADICMGQFSGSE